MQTDRKSGTRRIRPSSWTPSEFYCLKSLHVSLCTPPSIMNLKYYNILICIFKALFKKIRALYEIISIFLLNPTHSLCKTTIFLSAFQLKNCRTFFKSRLSKHSSQHPAAKAKQHKRQTELPPGGSHTSGYH